jgi:hypothetical protein
MQSFLPDDDPVRIKICGTEICSYNNKERLTCVKLIVYSLCRYPLLSCIVSLPLVFGDSCYTSVNLTPNNEPIMYESDTPYLSYE